MKKEYIHVKTHTRKKSGGGVSTVRRHARKIKGGSETSRFLRANTYGKANVLYEKNGKVYDPAKKNKQALLKKLGKNHKVVSQNHGTMDADAYNSLMTPAEAARFLEKNKGAKLPNEINQDATFANNSGTGSSNFDSHLTKKANMKSSEKNIAKLKNKKDKKVASKMAAKPPKSKHKGRPKKKEKKSPFTESKKLKVNFRALSKKPF